MDGRDLDKLEKNMNLENDDKLSVITQDKLK
jgi:hypothetical protein